MAEDNQKFSIQVYRKPFVCTMPVEDRLTIIANIITDKLIAEFYTTEAMEDDDDLSAE